MSYEFHVSEAENAINYLDIAFEEVEHRLSQLMEFVQEHPNKKAELDYRIKRLNKFKRVIYKKYRKFISKEFPVYIEEVDENGNITQIKVN